MVHLKHQRIAADEGKILMIIIEMNTESGQKGVACRCYAFYVQFPSPNRVRD
jgi:hypothetical protein